MPPQTYENHAHRPTASALAFLLLVLASAGFVLRFFGIGGTWAFVLALSALIGSIFCLIYISRVYIVRLQNRIIRLEMRVRCAPLLTPEQLRALESLDTPRLVALRFASDEEIGSLLDRTLRESLTPAQIKRAVKTWVPDVHRT
jgi:hypothetical protein